MKLKSNSSTQKLSGAYYTPVNLANEIIKKININTPDVTILEPSCGDGVFIHAVVNDNRFDQSTIEGIEIDQEAVAPLINEYKDSKRVTIKQADFFDFYREEGQNSRYDIIVGNPPYIRYQYLEEKQRTEMSKILSANGMKENKLINTWVAFTVACVQMLSHEGVIAFVIPAEILQVAYAKDLRLFLSNNLDAISLITFRDLIFPDIEQEVVVLIGEKTKKRTGIRIIELDDIDAFLNADLEKYEFQPIRHVHEKWTKYFTNSDETAFITNIKSDDRFQKLSDCALINVGVTTGNNKYFSVTKDIVEQYDLQSVVIPLIGRSSHANSVFFTEKDWLENVNDGKRAYLIDFPDVSFDEYPENNQRYILLGESTGENVGYKLSIRDRWYRIPSIWIPDAFFLRRNNLYPKFVLNRCGAISTDTMHRLKFNDPTQSERIVLSYYNSISFAFTEICGRSYGGGVLEILPGETGEIMVPKLDIVPSSTIHKILEYVDSIVRTNHDIEEALDYVDEEILIKYLGVSKEMCTTSRKIWKKLQGRRLARGKMM